MSLHLKPLDQQVVVITGATSGIGLVTARMASKRGASLVLAARNADALNELANEIQAGGGEAIAVPTDVSKQDEVRRLAEAAVQRFGRIDSWVNDAAVAIYGTALEVPVDDHRQLFETNYWGLVYGTLEAARHMRQRGGAIVNLGSILSDMSVPLQAPYVASKHAIKGFTNAFRMELAHDGAPISVTLIKPSGIDTPYAEHARNFMGMNPIVAPPIYPPRLVARAILRACETPTREIVVGGAGWLQKTMYNLMPALSEGVFASKAGYRMQMTDRRADPSRRDNLYAPKRGMAERSSYNPQVVPVSPMTELQLNPTLVLGAAAALATLFLGVRAIAGGDVRSSFERANPRSAAGRLGRR